MFVLRSRDWLKISVKTNPTLVRGTVVLNIHPNNISQKETEMELLLDDDTLAKAANYISMGQNVGKLGGVLHSVANVGPKKTASRLLNSMKLTDKDDMVSSLFDRSNCLFVYFNIFQLCLFVLFQLVFVVRHG